MNLKVVLDFEYYGKPRLMIGEPKDFGTNSGLLMVGWHNNSITDFLEVLQNKSFALVFMLEQPQLKDEVMKIICSRKISWFYNSNKSWFSPRRISGKDDLRKQINRMKRVCTELEKLMPF